MIRILLLVLAAIAACAGCAGTAREPFAVAAAGAPSWPSPPEKARIAHVASVTRHQDMFEEDGLWNALARVVGGPRESRMVRPYAIALLPEGGLVVSDPGAACVHVFDWANRRYTALGEGTALLPSPVGVAVADDGSILVADSRLRRIERFSRRGKHLGMFADSAALRRPTGIAVDPANGDVHVADALAHAIVVFDRDGGVSRTIGANGADPGEFNFPTHLAFDADGNLLVADSMNFRIQRMSAGGRPIACFGTAGDAQGDFAHPKGVAAIDSSTFVAVEGLYDSLVFFDSEGRLLLSIGGGGSEAGEFWLPSGIAFDAERRLLFVADSYNARVQAFRMLQEESEGRATPGAVP